MFLMAAPVSEDGILSDLSREAATLARDVLERVLLRLKQDVKHSVPWPDTDTHRYTVTYKVLSLSSAHTHKGRGWVYRSRKRVFKKTEQEGQVSSSA